MIVGQLPDDNDRALAVLDYAKAIVELGICPKEEQPKAGACKRLTLVSGGASPQAEEAN